MLPVEKENHEAASNKRLTRRVKETESRFALFESGVHPGWRFSGRDQAGFHQGLVLLGLSLMAGAIWAFQVEGTRCRRPVQPLGQHLRDNLPEFAEVKVVQIPLGRAHLGVAQKLAHGDEVPTLPKGGGRIGVAQGVGRHLLRKDAAGSSEGGNEEAQAPGR